MLVTERVVDDSLDVDLMFTRADLRDIVPRCDFGCNRGEESTPSACRPG